LFSERIHLIGLQKNQAQACSIQKVEELFNSLLKKAFKGKLVEEPPHTKVWHRVRL
jgi:hypothetical protein